MAAGSITTLIAMATLTHSLTLPRSSICLFFDHESPILQRSVARSVCVCAQCTLSAVSLTCFAYEGRKEGSFGSSLCKRRLLLESERPLPGFVSLSSFIYFWALIIASSYYQPSTVSAGNVIIGNLRVS